MRYTITKIRNGLWELEWEDGVKTHHSLRDGAERMRLQREHYLSEQLK